MSGVVVRSQRELSEAVRAGRVAVCETDRLLRIDEGLVEARGRARLLAGGRSRVLAAGEALVEARGLAAVEAAGRARVVVFERARVKAFGDVSVTAFGSAGVEAVQRARVEAFGLAAVQAWDSAVVRAGPSVSVVTHGDGITVTGGVPIAARKPQAAQEWLEHYGVPVVDGVAVLYKATGGDYETMGGVQYTPGTVPRAPDWDPGPETGLGLHFSPSPALALRFRPDARRFVACPVRVDEIVVHANAMRPEKVKAPGCCGPVWECDLHGRPLGREERRPAREQTPP